MTVLANARQTVGAPTRRPRRFGLFSVAEVVDDSDAHWMYGGLTAEGEECSVPEWGEIDCGPSPNKAMRSWYSDIEGDPWLAYMFETCKTVGRVSTTLAATQARFEAAEQSAVEWGFQASLLPGTHSVTGGDTIVSAIGRLEQKLATEYGAQGIIWLPPSAAAEAKRYDLIERVGDHLETISGNLAAVVNFNWSLNDGTDDAPNIYATGSVVLHRSPLSVTGPVIDPRTNDYFMLVERAYAGLVDCFAAATTAPLCGCGGSGGSDGALVLDQFGTLDLSGEAYAIPPQDCVAAVAFMNGNVIANPASAWTGGGAQVLIPNGSGSTMPCNVTWNGSVWSQETPV